MADGSDRELPLPSPLTTHAPSPPPSTPYGHARFLSPPPRRSGRERKPSRRLKDGALSEELIQAQRTTKRENNTQSEMTSRKKARYENDEYPELRFSHAEGRVRNRANNKRVRPRRHPRWSRHSEEEMAKYAFMELQAEEYFTAVEQLPTSAPPTHLLSYSGRLQQYEQTVADGAVDDNEPDETSEQLAASFQQAILDTRDDDHFMERVMHNVVYSDSLRCGWEGLHPNEIPSFSLDDHFRTTWFKSRPRTQYRKPKHPLEAERENFYEVARRVEDQRRVEENRRREEGAYPRLLAEQQKNTLNPLNRVRADLMDEDY